MRIITLLSFLLFASEGINAQCLSTSLFRIDSIGTYKEKLAIPLFVAFQGDSVIISPNRDMKYQLMFFKILSEPKCKWNDDFSEGVNSYDAMLVDSPEKTESVTINLIYKDATNRFIEILYKEGEERVLKIREVLR